MWSVRRSKNATKELYKAPIRIREAFDAWANVVVESGPSALRLINGYWDHALSGEWQGARSSSLSKEWRVIYVVDAETVSVLVVRVSAHDYRRLK